MRVSPFGHLRIKAYVRLPGAFRSLSRPSSAPSAKASALRSSSLDQSVSFDLFVLRFLAFYARTLLRSFPYVRRSFPAALIFCYLNDNASIDVLRRSFLLLRLPILRVHKLPLLSLKFMLCKIIVYAVFKVRYRRTLRSGDEGIRTPDPLLARQVLSQLSYTPVGFQYGHLTSWFL